VLGLSGTLTGAAIFAALCVDAITDPLMGSLSDNTHSRWGRRHPYMYAAALPMGLCFFLLFNPPALSQMGLFLWMCCFAIGVRASMTLYAVPSGAMLPELTRHYDERTSLVSYRFLFGWYGGLSVSLLGYGYFFATTEAGDQRFDESAYRAFAVVCALLIVTTILICAAGTHRLIPGLRRAAHDTGFTLRRFLREFGNAIANPSYRALVFATLFAAAAGGFSDVVGLYVNTFFWELPAQRIGVIVGGLFLAPLFAFAITRPLTQRWDKKPAAVRLTAFAITWGPAPVLLRLAGLFPGNDHPLLLPLLVVHAIVIVTAIVAISITIASMVADVVDENELATGERQEGMFASVTGFSAKATSGLGGLVAGVALDLIDFPRGAAVGAISPEKVQQLGLAVGPGLMGFYFALLLFLSRYRITRERHGEIVAELDRRREASIRPAAR
jgi:Na+/melibiose symporter-like transporter